MGDSVPSARNRSAGKAAAQSTVAFVDVPADLSRVAPDQLVVLLSMHPWAETLPELVRELINRRAGGIVMQETSTPSALLTRLAELATAHGVPVYVVPPRVGLGEALAELQADRQQFRVGGSIGHHLIMQANSLSQLSDALSRQIVRSVTIEDREFGVLAYSAQDRDVDSARVNSILRKHVPAEVVSALRKHGIPQKLRTASKPMRVEPIPEIGLGHRLVMPLRLGKELLGHIWVIDPLETLSAGMTDLLEQAADRAVQLLARDQQAVQKRRLLIETFLQDLFLGRFPTEEAAALQLRLLGISLSPTRVVLLISLGESTQQAGSLLYALETAGAKLNGEIVACQTGNAIWALCGLPAGLNGSQLRQQVTRLVRETMEHPSVRETPLAVSMGVGLPVSSLLETRNSYDNAAVAVKWGACLQEHPRVMFCEDLGALRLVQLPTPSAVPYPRSRALQLLAEYDQKKGTDLLPSLEMFLEEAGNVRRAATRLHVHPNSMLYRLQRIQQVTGMDLDSGSVRLMLHLELKVQSLIRAEDSGSLSAQSVPQSPRRTSPSE
jgi:sugar diacid utilization regulator